MFVLVSLFIPCPNFAEKVRDLKTNVLFSRICAQVYFYFCFVCFFYRAGPHKCKEKENERRQCISCDWAMKSRLLPLGRFCATICRVWPMLLRRRSLERCPCLDSRATCSHASHACADANSARSVACARLPVGA